MPTKRKSKLGDAWVTPKRVYEELSISKHTLDRLRHEILKKGVHYLDVNPRSTPRYRYNLEQIKKLLIDLT